MKNIWLTIIFCFKLITAFAQADPHAHLTALAQLKEKLPAEKLYLQTDKPYYMLGDTLRFKAYLLNKDLTPSTRSGLLYIEVDDISNRFITRIMVPVVSGISWGDITLDELQFPQGSYTLRAYTNWMLNFGDDYIYKKNINISALSGTTLVKANFTIENGTDKDKIQADLLLTGIDHNPARLKDMQLRVLNGKRTLFKQNVSTGMDGRVSTAFTLANKTDINGLAITLQETNKAIEKPLALIVPITINRPEKTDLQFMPEGGHMVASIQTKIGFKALGEDGHAVNVSGVVYDSHGQEVARFQSAHKGMGSFELIPQAGESYTAKIKLLTNLQQNYPLPVVNLKGTALRVIDRRDSVSIIVSTTPDERDHPTSYYLLALARGLVCYAARINPATGTSVVRVAKSIFPSGITHFTLLNETDQVVNERVLYINHNDSLQINITPNRQHYKSRDSVALTVQVNGSDGKPVQGNFALAVTDDSQVHTDSLGSTIINDLLFTADLKGTVEDPGYYLENPDQQKAAELDNLLLTQGWVGYDWKELFNPKSKPPKYAAEPEFLIKGKVTNILGKAVAGSAVALFSRHPTLLLDTLTDKDGIFTFKGLFPVDTAVFSLTSHNKHGKNNNVGIDMLNEFTPPVFSTPTLMQTPWYVNSDTVRLSNATTKIAQLKAEADFKGEGTRLKEVTIKDKKIIKDSHNLNGPGEYDQAIDEQEILKAGKMTLGDLLEKKIKGFQLFGMAGLSPFSRPFATSYTLDFKLIQFIIDGMNLSYLYKGESIGPLRDPNRINFIKPYLDYFTAEDIKGIEVMIWPAHASEYNFHFMSSSSPDFAYIEITTRGGHGPYMSKTPGTYLYKPLPFTLPTAFYRPRYTINNYNTGIGTDLRSTIHWEPNIVTDVNGRAIVSFYTADKPVGYTIIMEGTDFNGNFGYYRKKIKVDKGNITAK